MGTDKIVVRNQGEVEDSGLVNWRGDQTVVPQGGQGVYQASTVQLARLGSRKVVGDRVYRYARAGAGGTISAGQLCQAPDSNAGEISVVQTTAGQHNIGQKTLNLYSSGSVGADEYNEGYVFVCEGTTPGPMYRIKDHGDIAATATGTLTLYDALVTTHTAADQVSVLRNMYNKVVECGATGDVPVGVSPITVTTNDYFWLQTWGPCAIFNSTGTGIVAKGGMAFVGGTGAVQPATAAGTSPMVGIGMALATANEESPIFLMIAP